MIARKPVGVWIKNMVALGRVLSRAGVALLPLAAAEVACAASSGVAPVRSSGAAALKRLSLEELFEQEVVSVSRKPESLSHVASGIVVVTQDDIRRSSATTLPEALRLASNLQVAQINSQDWAISARGFNGAIANKLQVMIDGRIVYTPLFSGVFWDAQDVFLPDVDRIEVISGPAGTTWGANAVNGVINILSKRPDATQGWLLYGGGGREENGFGGIRYGGRIGDAGFFRVYAQHLDRDSSLGPGGIDQGDDWHTTRGGFRATWGRREDGLNVQGDLYRVQVDRPGIGPRTQRGGNLLLYWTKTPDSSSQMGVRFYYDYTRRSDTGFFLNSVDTYDLDLYYRTTLGARHELVSGLNYRVITDDTTGSASVALFPGRLTLNTISGFVQDEIKFSDGDVRLAAGSKFEHNDYSGFEYQPNVRVAWHVRENHSVWGAISRAVRTPSRIDRDFFLPGIPPFVLEGGPNFDSEKLWAYEAGYRGQPNPRVTIAATVFHHDYDDLRSIEPTGSGTFVVGNGLKGRGYGAELQVASEISDWVRVRFGYTYLRVRTQLKPGSADFGGGQGEHDDPQNQFMVGMSFDLPYDLELDLNLRQVDALPTPMNVPDYRELDCRLGWRVRDDLTLSVVGRNLLDRAHPEFGAAAGRREIQRTVFARAEWTF